MIVHNYTLSSGVVVGLSAVSSVELMVARGEIADPEVPRFHIVDQDRWVENPHHPEYLRGVEEANRRRGDVVFEALLRHGVTVALPKSDGWLRSLRRYSNGDPTVERLDTGVADDLKLLYLLVNAIQGESDVSAIVLGCCLVESRVLKFMRSLGLMRSGTNIDEAGLRFSIDTGIGAQAVALAGHTLVSPTEEYNACVHANLSWHRWRTLQYSIQFMEEAIAHHRVRRLVELHSSDAQQAESLRKARQKS